MAGSSSRNGHTPYQVALPVCLENRELRTGRCRTGAPDGNHIAVPVKCHRQRVIGKVYGIGDRKPASFFAISVNFYQKEILDFSGKTAGRIFGMSGDHCCATSTHRHGSYRVTSIGAACIAGDDLAPCGVFHTGVAIELHQGKVGRSLRVLGDARGNYRTLGRQAYRISPMEKGGGADNRREPYRIACLAIESPDEKCTEILSCLRQRR
jgi:hypothetical protein